MANNIDLTICAPKPSFRRFRCSAWLIFQKKHTVLFLPKRSCFRFASLTLRTPHRSPVSLCFSPKRTTSRFASLTLRLRTETFFQKVPVFRMAYSVPTAHRAVSSETLMLQVRFAHPPNCAPLSRFFVLFSKTHDLQVRFAHPPNPAPSYRFFVLFRSAFFPSAHRSPVSSPLAAAAALWLPCVRGAVRRRAGLRGCLRVRGKGKGPAVPFPSLRTEPALRAAPVFRSAYSASRNARASAAFAASIEAHCAFSSKTLMLQVRFAHPPNPAPSSRLFSISRRSGLRGCRHRAESTHYLTPSGCVPSGGAGAPPAPPLPPPSRCRPDRFKGSP